MTWRDRLLEGPHPWGWVQVGTPGRGGWRVIRLTVYPPGTNSAERRALTLCRNWPALGAILALVIVLAGGGSIEPWTLTALAVALYVGGFLIAHRATRRLRRRVREVSAAQFYEYGVRREIRDVARVCGWIATLEALDATNADRSLTAVEYEERWGAVYDELEQYGITLRTASQER